MSTLSLNLVPGALPADGELITNATLRAIARPTITLEGEIGAASITDGAVTTAKLADGALSADTTGRAKMADAFVTAAKLASSLDLSGKTITGNPSLTVTGTVDLSGATLTAPAGMLVQQVQASYTTRSTIAAATPGGTIPMDDTVPQNNEGTEILTASITPKATTNRLEITAIIPIAIENASAFAAVALFQDSTAGALAAIAESCGTNASLRVLTLHHTMAAGTTSATTFKLRVGVTANNVFINGDTAGNRLFGGVSAVRLFIKEITA